MAAGDTVKPPEGFILDEPKPKAVAEPAAAPAKSALPAPPDGFVLDAPEKGQIGPVSEALRARIAGPLGRKAAQAASDTFKQMDRDVDYSGVAATGLRAQFGFLDTPQERQDFLKANFGAENVTTDSFGRDVVIMNGQKVAFLPRGGKDEGKPGAAGAGWADLAGDIAPVGGMIAGSMATAPLPGASIIGAGVGGAGGKGINKLIKEVMGANRQAPMEIAADIGKEVPIGMAGQGAALGIGMLGRSILRGPFREGSIFGPITERGKAVFAKAQEEVAAARALGLKPKVGTYSPNASFTQRVQNAGFRLFGDDLALKNRPILEAEARKLTGGAIANTPEGTEAINKVISARAEQVQKTAKAVADAARVDAENALKVAENLITDRVGAPSGELAAKVTGDIQAAKSAFSVKASELYAPVDAIAGKPVVPTDGLKAVMKEIIDEGPQTVKGQPLLASDTIKKFASDLAALPDNITFQQMQVARSTLRDYSSIQALNVGLSERQAARLAKAADRSFDEAKSLLLETKKTPILDAAGKPIITVTPKFVTGVDEAMTALRNADKFYADGIVKFNDLTVKSMVKDATQSGFVEPERVAARLAQPGMNDKLTRIKEVVTPGTFGEIGSARWKQMLDTSRDPLTGDVSGRRLASQLNKMGPVLENLYGKAEAGRMTQYAQSLAALDGKIDAATLQGGQGNLSALVRDAVLKKEASDATMSRGFVNALKTDGPQSLTAAQWLTEPQHRLPMRSAISAFGPQSQEVAQLKEYMARRIFSSMEVPATRGAEKSGTTEFMGEPLQKELERYGRPYLEEVFGKRWTDAAYTFAKNAEVATRKNPTDSGGLVAATIGLHWMRHLGEIARYFTAGELLSTEPVITYLSRGVQGKGIDFLQTALGKGMQAGVMYEAEELPKRAADTARGFATHSKSKFGNMLDSTRQGAR